MVLQLVHANNNVHECAILHCRAFNQPGVTLFSMFTFF